MVTGLEVGYLLPNLLHNAGGLVTQYGRSYCTGDPVYVVKVAVAHAAGDGADYDLPGHGRINVDLFDGERRIRGVKNCGFNGAPSVADTSPTL